MSPPRTLGGTRGDRRRIHPNDDVNLGQSTNNIFPSAIKIAGVELRRKLLAALRKLMRGVPRRRRRSSTP